MTTTHITNRNVVLTVQIEKVNDDTPEPPCGTVIMLHGLTGTAWQRFYNDGKWHSVTGQDPKTWDWIKSLKRDDTFIILYGEEDDDD